MKERRYIRSLLRDAVRRRKGKRDARSRAEVAAFEDSLTRLASWFDCRDAGTALEQLARLAGNIPDRDEREGKRAAYELAATMARNAKTY